MPEEADNFDLQRSVKKVLHGLSPRSHPPPPPPFPGPEVRDIGLKNIAVALGKAMRLRKGADVDALDAGDFLAKLIPVAWRRGITFVPASVLRSNLATCGRSSALRASR